MIEIKEEKENETKVIIKAGTSYITILMGVEILIEKLVKDNKTDIDVLLGDLKYIYLRDNDPDKLKK